MAKEQDLPAQIYSQINLKLNEQVKEFYTLVAVFTTLNTLIFTFLALSLNSDKLIFKYSAMVVGLIVSLIWFESICIMERWKKAWMNEIKEIELNYFKTITPWTKVLQLASDYKFGSVTNMMKLISLLFSSLWIFLIIHQLIS